MNPHLHDTLAQQRIADLQQAAEHARLATDAGAQRRDSRDSSPIVRALPMPTAHPSPEAWPDAAAERSKQLTRLVYELLDAHAGTEHLSQTRHSELLWHAHLGYLRDLQRVAREVLADVS